MKIEAEIQQIVVKERIIQQSEELTQAYNATLSVWARVLELFDKDTEGHTRRVTDLVVRLTRAMGIPEKQIGNIQRGAILHDLGKLAIPDGILHKAGELTQAERKIMRKHPQHAYEMLSDIPFLHSAIDIPYCHHERWNGTGYPRGLRREEIPLAARIFSVVDVYDALISDRPYHQAWKSESAITYIIHEANRKFDPQVVKVFIKTEINRQD
jgi:HD-GYP domain-containing protein (c-di-GMP phosphodiesterase class II)